MDNSAAWTQDDLKEVEDLLDLKFGIEVRDIKLRAAIIAHYFPQYFYDEILEMAAEDASRLWAAVEWLQSNQAIQQMMAVGSALSKDGVKVLRKLIKVQKKAEGRFAS